MLRWVSGLHDRFFNQAAFEYPLGWASQGCDPEYVPGERPISGWDLGVARFRPLRLPRCRSLPNGGAVAEKFNIHKDSGTPPFLEDWWWEVASWCSGGRSPSDCFRQVAMKLIHCTADYFRHAKTCESTPPGWAPCASAAFAGLCHGLIHQGRDQRGGACGRNGASRHSSRCSSLFVWVAQ